MVKTDLQKILLVQLFSNGDCLYATTVARQIKNDFPGCELTWCIAESCARILELNPFVDHVRIVQGIPKNDVAAYRKFKRSVVAEKAEGKWDQVFITHNADNNLALYDGTIRGMILRAYPGKISVPVQPVLVLSDQEKNNVSAFAQKYQLLHFKNVILWEFAPQSGQTIFDFDFVMTVAKMQVSDNNTCIILSSANKIESTHNIIDASTLSVRENAALTHYCNLLIGCSSGITWLNTSSAGAFIPMLQLLDEDATFRNAPSIDFERHGLAVDKLIELYTFDSNSLNDCIDKIKMAGFDVARQEYTQHPKKQFNTTNKIVYNLLCYMQFAALARHFRITTHIYGWDSAFISVFFKSFFTFPFNLLKNIFKKRIFKNR